MPLALPEIALLAIPAILSAVLLARGLLTLKTDAKLDRRLDGLKGMGADDSISSQGASWAHPILQVFLGNGAEREEVEQYLAMAGYRGPNAALIFTAVRLGALLIVGGGLLWWALQKTPLDPKMLFIALAGAAVAYLGPKQLLRLLGSQRQRKVNAELPFTLDMFVMMLESGISIDQCFRTFAQTEGRSAPLVREAVIMLVRDLEHGAPHDLALTRWAERLGVPGARELARVIQRSLANGTPLGKTLKEFSHEFSEKRVAVAKESVGRKSTQMTLAMMLFIMPPLFIVLAGPAVATLGGAIRSVSSGS